MVERGQLMNAPAESWYSPKMEIDPPFRRLDGIIRGDLFLLLEGYLEAIGVDVLRRMSPCLKQMLPALFAVAERASVKCPPPDVMSALGFVVPLESVGAPQRLWDRLKREPADLSLIREQRQLGGGANDTGVTEPLRVRILLRLSNWYLMLFFAANLGLSASFLIGIALPDLESGRFHGNIWGLIIIAALLMGCVISIASIVRTVIRKRRDLLHFRSLLIPLQGLHGALNMAPSLTRLGAWWNFSFILLTASLFSIPGIGLLVAGVEIERGKDQDALAMLATFMSCVLVTWGAASVYYRFQILKRSAAVELFEMHRDRRMSISGI
jgi:hypothetical protein